MIRPGFDHVGIVVPDIGYAMERLTELFNVEWSGPVPGAGGIAHMQQAGKDPAPITVTAVMSSTKPGIELIQAMPDTPWQLDGPGWKLHHIAFWTDTLVEDSHRLLSCGCPMVLQGVGKEGDVPNTFTYQMLEEGVIFELLHESFLKNGERQVKLGCVWDD